MRRLIVGAFVIGLLVGCKKAQPTASPPQPSNGSPPAASKPASDKPNYLANELKPRATFKLGVTPQLLDRLFLSQNGSRLAISLDQSEKTQIWDLSGEPRKLQEFTGAVRAFAPDGKLCVRLDIGKREIVSADTGTVVCQLQYDSDLPLFLRQFRSSKVLVGVSLAKAAAGAEGELVVRQFDTADGRETSSFRVPYDQNRSTELLRHLTADELFIADNKSKQVSVWALATGKLDREFNLAESPGTGFEFSVSPDGKWVMASSVIEYQVFDARTGARVGAGPKGAINARFVPGTELLAARVIFSDEKLAMHDGSSAWAFRRNESVAFIPTDALDVAFSDDGKVGATFSKSGTIQLWDLGQLANK